ncbi:hypothetical protein JAO10_07775 [Burkholderia contaminans]|uniref:hypothetical protein n=1 Tax=Burkholderia cepacia complex TaxID=87882 RepID=UPI0018DCD2B9|nr:MULTISPECIES: hypothetical protein [Burkholderia cepacia complex]MBH9720227.1 hypothetical protein [Burkholderia contaminans]MBR8013460.1 hypothetical protein [Burkholderia vietnamiensis]HDR9039760.1 hypothetical protein [Burkholderia vietnamiensis]HDR9196437.1 hypothetical protein [Burkholderia vietnamiensis]
MNSQIQEIIEGFEHWIELDKNSLEELNEKIDDLFEQKKRIEHRMNVSKQRLEQYRAKVENL